MTVRDDVLSLRVRSHTDSTWRSEVEILINDVPLRELLARHGDTGDWLSPPLSVLAPPSDHLRGGPDRWEDADDSWFDDGLVAVAACQCGQPGCDAILMRVERIFGAVRWTAFQWYRRPDVDLSAVELTFDQAQYDDALDSLTSA
ncbi:MAG: hypothetical protein M3Q30_22690 [Actinomycetota bacterium]|nr:hypothetical protein [Actinomycetota bacterium]